MRVSKFLASLGIGARRKIDVLIEQKKIFINDSSALLGQKLNCGDKIFLEGKLVATYTGVLDKTVKLMAYHKPIHTLCAHEDKSDKVLIYDTLPLDNKEPWITIGRLDFKTTGLILITNCGQTAHNLMHPSQKIKRTYEAKISPALTPKDKESIEKGLLLEDGIAHVDSCSLLKTTASGSWVSLSLFEGRNREVRRIFESLRYRVLKLKRTLYGPITLKNIEKPGQIKEVSVDLFKTK